MINTKLALKSSIVLTSLLLIVGNFGYSAEQVKEQIEIPKNEIYGAYRDYKNEIGFFNYDGSMIKKPQFDLMWQWDDEVIILRDHGQYGCIDFNGLLAVPFEYEFLDQPSQGTIIYGKDITFEGPTYYGLIDTKGHQIVEAQFDTVEKLPNGGILTSIVYPEGRKYGAVFKNKVNVRPIYDGFGAYNNQFVIVKNKVDNVWKYGFLSETGSRSLVEYSNVQLTDDGDFVVAEKMYGNQKKYQLLNKYNNEISPQLFAYISPKGFADNQGNDKHFITVSTFQNGKISGTLDLLTRSGELQNHKFIKVDYTPILGQYYQVTDVSGRIGLVDSFGHMMIEPIYTAIESWNDTYFVGVVGDARGVFNIKGQALLDLSNYEHIQLTEDGYFVAGFGKQFNIFDTKGMLKFQYQADMLTGIGNNRFITKTQSIHQDADGTKKYYYNLINETGRQRIKLDQYVYMNVIGDGLIAVGRDIDGKASYPSGIEYLRAPFADVYGVVDYDGEEIIPANYVNLTPCHKGIILAQASKDSTFEAFDEKGKKINKEAIWTFDSFNPGVVTVGPNSRIQKSGYLTHEGEFMQLVFEQSVDDTLIKQRLEMEDSLIHVIEVKTSVFSKKEIDNLVNEDILKEYIDLKARFGGEIYILKDKEWYLDNFYQPND
jgi:hypothetical protein